MNEKVIEYIKNCKKKEGETKQSKIEPYTW